MSKKIALEEMKKMFELARETLPKDPTLAQRYASIACKISTRERVRIPPEYSRMICRHCKKFILPSVNCRVRIQQRREPHVVITCLLCDGKTRIPLRRRLRRNELANAL